MGRHTKKVGICGKYGTRYGASIRKNMKKQEVAQHMKYNCQFCGKDTVKRRCAGIWECKACKRVSAGGAYMFNTPAATTARTTLARTRKIIESRANA